MRVLSLLRMHMRCHTRLGLTRADRKAAAEREREQISFINAAHAGWNEIPASSRQTAGDLPAPEEGPWPWLPVPRLPSPLSSVHGHLASKNQHERSLSTRACSPDARDARPSGAALDLLRLRGMGCKWPGSPAAGVGWPWGRGSTLSSAPGVGGRP